jgi:ribose-phosphate pyrophosphokinase
MILLNLDKNFAPFGQGIEFQSFEFPSGCEPHIKLAPLGNADKAKITCRLRNGNDFLRLLLATDALRRSDVKDIELFMPYLPFARQDRVMVAGEPLSVRVICDILNTQNYSKIQVYDAHSEVAPALLNNCEAISNHAFVAKALEGKKNYLIVSPDAGAYKKIFKLCQYLQYKEEIVLCNKIRNVATGSIDHIKLAINDFKGSDLYIVDDICDGGGTFILLTQELKKRNAGSVNLIVSHGIFSKGIEALEGIDHVYTSDSFADWPESERLTQIKLKDLW